MDEIYLKRGGTIVLTNQEIGEGSGVLDDYYWILKGFTNIRGETNGNDPCVLSSNGWTIKLIGWSANPSPSQITIVITCPKSAEEADYELYGYLKCPNSKYRRFRSGVTIKGISSGPNPPPCS